MKQIFEIEEIKDILCSIIYLNQPLCYDLRTKEKDNNILELDIFEILPTEIKKFTQDLINYDCEDEDESKQIIPELEKEEKYKNIHKLISIELKDKIQHIIYEYEYEYLHKHIVPELYLYNDIKQIIEEIKNIGKNTKVFLIKDFICLFFELIPEHSEDLGGEIWIFGNKILGRLKLGTCGGYSFVSIPSEFKEIKYKRFKQ